MTKKISPFLKKFLLANIVIDILIAIPLIWFFVFFPRVEIASLKTGYVRLNIKEGKVIYKVVQKKPMNWVNLSEVNYTAAHAFVVSEDWAFYQHSGYDLGQIKEAFSEAIAGDRARGASTISQQVVKNIFLSHERSIVRKLKELIYSIYLERNVPKSKILEIYLNVIEYGDGIYGITEASRVYFNKTPHELMAREGAFMAMLLPSPKRYSESFKRKEMTKFAQKTVDRILEKMVRAKYLKKEQLDAAKNNYFHWEDPSKALVEGLEKSGVEDLDEQTNDEGLNIEDEELLRQGAQPKGITEEPRKRTHKASKKISSSASLKGKKKRKKIRRKKRKKPLSDDARYQDDPELELEENPEFDEDALEEELPSIQEEFSVE